MKRAELIMRSAEKRLSRALAAFEDEEPLDEAFGAPSAVERAHEEAERRHMEVLERLARSSPAPGRSREALSWIHRKAWGGK